MSVVTVRMVMYRPIVIRQPDKRYDARANQYFGHVEVTHFRYSCVNNTPYPNDCKSRPNDSVRKIGSRRAAGGGHTGRTLAGKHSVYSFD
jgi:hypothetical protein